MTHRKPANQCCALAGCVRNGQKVRYQLTRELGLKGGRTGDTVSIHVFVCELYGPQRFLHTQKVGPHGEKLEKLPGFAHYRFTDAVNGNVIQTESRRHEHVISERGMENIRAARRKEWSDPARRTRAKTEMSARAKAMWADPDMKARMTAANLAKAADPAFGRKISEGKLRAFAADPEKRRRVSEAVRQARLREQKILQAHRAAQLPRKKAGRPAGMSESTYNDGRLLEQHIREFEQKNGTRRGAVLYAARKVYGAHTDSRKAFERAKKTLRKFRGTKSPA